MVYIFTVLYAVVFPVVRKWRGRNIAFKIVSVRCFNYRAIHFPYIINQCDLITKFPYMDKPNTKWLAKISLPYKVPTATISE